MVLMFKSWPLLNTMATYGILWTASDIIQELIISRKDHVDWGKTLRVTATGACVIAPQVHGWMHIVEFMFPGSAVKMVIKKVVAGQICFAPVGISSFYLGALFWPFVQMCNFRYVPFRYKAVVVASGSFVWSIFLCFMKEENIQTKTEQPSIAALQETS